MALDTRIPMMASGLDLQGIMSAADRGRAYDQKVKADETVKANLGGALKGDQQSLEQILTADPDAGMKIMSYRSGLAKEERERKDKEMQTIAGLVAPLALGQVPAGQEQSYYASALTLAKARGIDVSTAPPQYDPNWAKGAYAFSTAYVDQIKAQRDLQGIKNDEIKTRNDTRATDARIAESGATVTLRQAQTERERRGDKNDYGVVLENGKNVYRRVDKLDGAEVGSSETGRTTTDRTINSEAAYRAVKARGGSEAEAQQAREAILLGFDPDERAIKLAQKDERWGFADTPQRQKIVEEYRALGGRGEPKAKALELPRGQDGRLDRTKLERNKTYIVNGEERVFDGTNFVLPGSK